MTQPTAQFGDYILPRMRKVAPIDYLVFDELGEAVLKIHNKLFKGVKGIVEPMRYNKDQLIKHSNVAKALSYNRILRELTNDTIRVASPADCVRYWDTLPQILDRGLLENIPSVSTDSIALFSSKGPNQSLAQIVFKILGRTSAAVPLLVAGLGVKKADNKYGFTFTETDFTKAVEAPWLIQPGKVLYDPATKGLVATNSKSGVEVRVPEDQSGLHVVSRDGDFSLGCWEDNYDMHVQIVQADLKDRAA